MLSKYRLSHSLCYLHLLRKLSEQRYRVSIAGDAARVSPWLLHYVSSFDAAVNEAKAGASKTNTTFRGSNSGQPRGKSDREVELEGEEEEEEANG